MGELVPLVIPEVNADHLDLVARQPWSGALVTNPNCAAVGLVVGLAPLHEAFGVESVVTTSFQAISGAGLPGPPAGSLVDNVIPFIGGEEHKLTCEPQKILGTLTPEGLAPAAFPVSASCTRVAVLDGHLMAVSVALAGKPSVEDVTTAFEEYRGSDACRDLPSAPERVLVVLPEDDRPQPRLDRDLGEGMTVSVGRIRPCEVLDIKFFVLSHNLVRGAAGAALLNAELCHAQGILGSG
jgi:aspartate-semialdehyde dehydrogenase